MEEFGKRNCEMSENYIGFFNFKTSGKTEDEAD